MAQTLTETAQKEILENLKQLNRKLDKLVSIFPEESLDEYENSAQIKAAYKTAVGQFPPK